MRERTLAIIPARGGSKRIQKKNIHPFRGRPLLAWTVEAALAAGCFSRVVVSTDDEEIARVAREWGAEVPFLRQLAADDHAPASAATLAAVDQCEEHWGETWDTAVQLFAVCPLRTAEHIRDAMAAFRASDAAFLLSAYRFHWTNPWWACTLDGNGVPTRLFPDAYIRSQDLPTLYSPSGAIWIAELPALREAGTFYGPGHIYWPMDWKAAVDIDTVEDLEIADTLFPQVPR
ncbi:MAG: acylneuraminate cytidylyltransferase family protein [Pseudomonadota bacterium]